MATFPSWPLVCPIILQNSSSKIDRGLKRVNFHTTRAQNLPFSDRALGYHLSWLPFIMATFHGCHPAWLPFAMAIAQLNHFPNDRGLQIALVSTLPYTLICFFRVKSGSSLFPQTVFYCRGSQFFLKRCRLPLWVCPLICLPSFVSLSGGVRLSGLVCALSPFIVSLHLSPFICLPSCVSLSGVVRSPVLSAPRLPSFGSVHVSP